MVAPGRAFQRPDCATTWPSEGNPSFARRSISFRGMSTRLPTRTGLIAPRFRCARIVQAEMASFSAACPIENKSFIATPFASETILLNPTRSVLDFSIVFRYLAEAGLQHHLALLPKRAELKGRKHTEVRGELGSEELDFASLREPPHKIFANWTPTPEGVLEFTKLYGLLDPTGKYCEWKLGDKGRAFSFKVASWIDSQKYFRQYWDWNKHSGNWDVVRHDLMREFMPWKVINAPELSHPGIELDYIYNLGPKPYILLKAQTLWQYLCTLLAFHSVGELRLCQNPDCPAPRFIARRKDQVYCSSDCAALLAKRRWWAKHGEEWRKERKRKKRKGGKH